MDMQHLTHQLDVTKSRVFLGENAAFLGPLMCSLEFIWDENIPTAATDGLKLWWNPTWFLSLDPLARCTVLMHEIWHPALLHMVRRGTRDPKIWNWACDIRINNDLKRDKFSFVGLEDAWMDEDIDKGPDGRLAEEQIYEILIKSGKQPPPQRGDGDLKDDDSGDNQDPNGPMGPSDQQQLNAAVINNVIRACHQATLAGKAGQIPGGIKQVIDKFLESIVPWETLLMKFFTDLLDEDYTWARPNRRYTDVYLPSRFTDEGRLRHLLYFIDVSGSVSNADVLRCNSEIKYIKDVLKPQKLTLCLFDTVIHEEYVFEEDDPFEKLVITGRGGTSFECVRQYINNSDATAAVIFSDMDCAPMGPLDGDVPIIWIGVNARGVQPPFGEIIHIRN